MGPRPDRPTVVSPTAVVLDTNILIAVSKQQFNPALLKRHYQSVLISTVSWAEALGFNFPNAAEEGRMLLFLKGLQVLPFTLSEAQHVVRYRQQSRKTKIPDAAILATARAAGADLLTQNTVDFRGLDPAVRVLSIQNL